MWYHAAEGTREGPLDEQAFAALVRQGRIGADTLVWREGMADWAPYGSLATDSATGAAEQPTCMLCKQRFAAGEMLPFGNSMVCANCKPRLVQTLREDASATLGAMRTAGFMIRLGAVIIDGVILAVPFWILVAMGVLEIQESSGNVAHNLISSSAGAVYEILMVGKYGATVGKMATGLRVVDHNGRPVTMGRSAGRYFAKILSGLPTLMIGYLMAAFDAENRALHDRICSTRVVRK
jgi:uncharacterized RDD family membrane protein YckC